MCAMCVYLLVSVCPLSDKTGVHAWTQMDSGKKKKKRGGRGGGGVGVGGAFSGPIAPAFCRVH